MNNIKISEETEEQLIKNPTLKSSFYTILGLSLQDEDGAKTLAFHEQKDIKKAVRTRSLKYHPDKLKPGIDDLHYSAKMFHLIQLASTTLSDPVEKTKYDDLLRAEALKELRFKEMDQQRQKGRRDLEERERLAQESSKKFKSSSGTGLSKYELLQLEKERIREEGESKMFSMMQQKRQDSARALFVASTLKKGPEIIKQTPLEACLLRVKWGKDAGKVDEIRLRNYYSKFGIIDRILIKEGKKSSTIVYKDVTGTFNAINLFSANSTNTTAKVPADPHFTHKLMAESVPEAFTYLSIKRDPMNAHISAADASTSSVNQGSLGMGRGPVAAGVDEYEKSTLNRLKEKERMRRQLLEEDGDGD